MDRIQKIFFILIFFIFSSYGYSQSAGLSQGEKLFKENKPEDAVQVLENEILNGQVSANTYNFLGLGYYQLGAYEKSVNAFQRGIEAQPSNIKILSFNQGNAYYALKKYDQAVSCYSKSLQDDGTFYDALLNRANALLMSNQYKTSREDYISFLEKCPEDPQRANIEEIIRLLADELERLEEEARLAAEANKAIWEQFDAPLVDNKGAEERGPDWEKVNDEIVNEEIVPDNPDWEQVEAEKINKKIVQDNSQADPISVEPEKISNEDLKVPELKSDTKSEVVVDTSNVNENPVDNWEQIDSVVENIKEEKEPVATWENLDESDLDEMKRLERESLLEREKYLAEQKRKKEQEELDKKLKEQMEVTANENYRDQIRQEMMAAEEARRQQLLDDVANSLRKTDSENMTSGTEDIIDYEFEGELD